MVTSPALRSTAVRATTPATRTTTTAVVVAALLAVSACSTTSAPASGSATPESASPIETVLEPVMEQEVETGVAGDTVNDAPTETERVVVEAAADLDGASVPLPGDTVHDTLLDIADDTLEDTTQDDDGDADDQDETPEPGSVPRDLVLLDTPGAPAGPLVFDPILQAPARVIGQEPSAHAATPTAPPAFVPVTLDDPDAPGGDGLAAGGLTLAAATGCADHCIDDATITTAGGSSSRYDLRVELQNAATVEAYLSLAPIARDDDGRPIRPSSVPTASGAAGFVWSTSFDLDAATTYHLLVRAIDEQGTSQVVGSFTTAEAMGPDELATPSACADGCLDDVHFAADDDGTAWSVGLTTSVDAVVEFAWSTAQFVFDDDGVPYLADPHTSSIESGVGSRTTLGLRELTPNTAYSVIITATDAVGGVDVWTARVATPSPIIWAGIDRVHVVGDGDDGRLDRGEIRFRFGEGGDVWGHRNEEKLPSNTGVRLGRDSASTLVPDGSGRYDDIRIYAGERDGRAVMTCFVAAEPGDAWWPEAVTWCNNARTIWSMTHAPSMTLAEIEQLPTCDAFNVANPDADHCLRIETPPNSSQQVSFEAVVYYDVD